MKFSTKSLQQTQKIGLVISVLALLALGGTQMAVGKGGTGFNYTTVDFPGAAGTAGQGINASGDLVGFYYGTAADLAAGGPVHGYLFANGAFITVDVRH